MKQLRVSDLMRDCSSAVVVETTLLRHAAEILVTHGFPGLIVQDEDEQLTGVIAESAVIRTLMSNDARSLKVASIQSRYVETIRQSADVGSVLHLFRSACHSFVPVVDETHRVVGVLYRSDIVRLLLDNADSADDARQPQSNSAPQPNFMKRRSPKVDADPDPEHG